LALSSCTMSCRSLSERASRSIQVTTSASPFWYHLVLARAGVDGRVFHAFRTELELRLRQLEHIA
jgi:hypothetical protein